MIKETHLHSLPNILIVHLQRIVFDLETTERTKIHTKFEFPMQMNLKDYLRMQPDEEAPAELDCQYRLKGVVIHSGNA
jgi:ubiquitin carboxyl-terminal hydrolase 34